MRVLSAGVLVGVAVATFQGAPRIDPKDAKKHVGKDVTICGRIVEHACSKKKDMVLLRLARVKNVVVAIPSSSAAQFGGRIEDRYLAADVCVTGAVGRVDKTYAVIVEQPDAVTLAGPNRPAAVFAPEAVRACRPDVEEPKLLREVKPNYTSAALQALRRGIVVMEAVVLADGSVGDVQVVRSLDKEYGLDAQAVLAVRQWRFEPGRVGGRVEPMIVTVEMSFTLK